MLVECHQPFVLLKVIQALYVRLTFMTDNNKGIFIRFTIELHCAPYLQNLAHYIFLEVSNDKYNNIHTEILRLEEMFKEDIDRSDEISKVFDRLSDALDSLTIDLVV